MRKLAIATLTLLLALTAFGQDQHQSYVTYDDGDSVLLQNDGREIDARMNLPVYPGDVIRTGKRGRTEIRLSDGNIVAIDRYSRVKFDSILGTYEGDDQRTVARLLEGQVILFRLHRGSEALRLDTSNASYLSSKEALYGVETNSRGIDIVTVFEGTIEVRTRQGSVVLRDRERAKVDLTGVYSRNELVSNGATEFEQWFIRRASRYSENEGRYLEGSLAYAEADLSENGRWVYVSEYSGYAWRPFVAVGWRPYYNGYWHVGWGGSLVWVGYEPWGWVTYHYGRWSHHPYYGWVWLPGYTYSPAWVYWAWGPSWVGWVPAGWYDCYWGYRGWYYYPHYPHYPQHHPQNYARGYGFYGRVTVSTKDLEAYTVIDRNVLYSNRVDRASLTADQIRNRLARDGTSGVLSNRTVRVTPDEMRDPSRVAERIIRGGDGSGTGKSQGTGSPADVTQFFQRDPNPSASVRDRVTRGLPRDTSATQTTRGTSGGGVTVPTSTQSEPGVVTRGTAGRGGVAAGGTVTRGGTGETVTRPTTGTTGGAVTRPGAPTGTRSDGGKTEADPRGGVVRPRVDTPEPGTVSRGGSDGGEVRPRTVTRPTSPGTTSSGNDQGSSARPRTVTRPEPTKPTETPSSTRETPARAAPKDDQPVSRAPSRNNDTATNDDWRRGSAGSTDPAQRVITTIGGARISSSASDGSSSAPRTRGGESSGDSWRSRGSFTDGSSTSQESTTTRSSSSSSSGSGRVSRPSSSGSSLPRGTKYSRPSSTSGGKSTSTGSSGSRSSGGGKSTATRSSGSRSGSSGGRAGISRPSSSGSSSGGSKSSGAKSSSNKSSSGKSSSSGKVSRNPD
jgi:hypothetical protein